VSAARDVYLDPQAPPQPQRTEGADRELIELRAICRRQELAMEALTSVVSALRRSNAALTEENKELRARIAGRHRSGGV
jgi:hypothetical protein